MRLLLAALLGGALALAGCAGGGSSSTTPSVVPVTAPAVVTPARPAHVRIPSLQVDANIIDLGLQSDGKMQVPPDAGDAGWYINSPIPGQVGPAVLAAHVDWKGVDGPFAHLDQLKSGDQVIVEGADGAEVTFAVDKVDSYPKTAFPADQVYADRPDAELVMITCGGDFDAAAHSYKNNIVAVAHRV